MKENNITINCLAFQLSMARKKVQKWYERYLEEYGLSTSYVYVMEVIKEFGPSSLSLIAEKIELERATVSTLLGRMERDGFIERLVGKERRSMEVHLTPKGKKVLNHALSSLQNADKELNELLSGNLDEIKSSIQTLNNKL
ncbi:MarR family winged helix-turn-helix transcriptional regulator [Fusibacter ferrireducens]|uniref:MarR family transcriptional regulator n=1 Tax=Fusibacter ferrireducens TaxID=2785058 RepID=A0ABR9ZNM6_9FIRM|nr:MarR family transcriptional regulator [Fusibacter ferrireducens]MBF4691591.1 MarR family transcriptional regulator [Fusibacter ferrireducens]